MTRKVSICVPHLPEKRCNITYCNDHVEVLKEVKITNSPSYYRLFEPLLILNECGSVHAQS